MNRTAAGGFLLFWIGLFRCVAAQPAEDRRAVFVIPNFHPASCGWLTDWSTERNYCANSYFDHLDRVRQDPHYSFALSECNNLIAMRNFAPERFGELKQRLGEGRVELVNAFFLEPTVNLSGGEALVKMGVEGLRWQQQVMGFRPRLSWMIDITGLHEQMAQIVAGLGLEALAYCRANPTGSTLHWLVSPDGTRTLALSPGHYLEWRTMFGARKPLGEAELGELRDDIRARIRPLPAEEDRKRPDATDLRSPPRRTPERLPVLILGGSGDYNLAPRCPSYPGEFLEQFRKFAPLYDVRFTTPGRYLDAVWPEIRSGKVALPTLSAGTAFTYKAFWIQNPRVKEWYRRDEQLLQAAEMLAAAASLPPTRSKGSPYLYPVQDLYHAWLLMLLNMDRNTLWGAAGGMVFEHEKSWDVRDRFETVEKIAGSTLAGAARSIAGPGREMLAFNPLNWPRQDPFMTAVPAGTNCQAVPAAGEWICRLDLPSVGLGPAPAPAPGRPDPETVPLPAVLETRHFLAAIDWETGSLRSLKLKPSGTELLAGPANVLVAEKPRTDIANPADHMADRPDRKRIADTDRPASRIEVRTGPLAVTVRVETPFFSGHPSIRTMVFYRDYPRIDFLTELNDIPDPTVVVAEFPLAGPVLEVRRGIPYGFSHSAWPADETGVTAAGSAEFPTGAGSGRPAGFMQGITPAVRWSHYQMKEAGLALFDRGLSGREINGSTPVIYLLNTAEKYRGYPNSWLSGAGRHLLRYALTAHAGDFRQARIPQLAWEFNQPPIALPGGAVRRPVSFLETGGNLIVEAMRREAGEIEVRLAECLGVAGEGWVRLMLPHRGAARTDLVGGSRQDLGGGPGYRFPVRPQQIVTLRFPTAEPVAEIRPLTEWDPLVPEKKREALHRYLPEVKGHPPAGN